jgi:hypothetical protein
MLSTAVTVYFCTHEHHNIMTFLLRDMMASDQSKEDSVGSTESAQTIKEEERAIAKQEVLIEPTQPPKEEHSEDEDSAPIVAPTAFRPAVRREQPHPVEPYPAPYDQHYPYPTQHDMYPRHYPYPPRYPPYMPVQRPPNYYAPPPPYTHYPPPSDHYYGEEINFEQTTKKKDATASTRGVKKPKVTNRRPRTLPDQATKLLVS